MGGKAPKADNSAIVQQQQADAAAAAAKEAARQQRLSQGLASIKQAFEGTPVTKDTTSAYDWSKFNPADVGKYIAAGGTGDQTDPTQYGLPSGYKVGMVTPSTGVSTPSTKAAYGSGAPSASSWGNNQLSYKSPAQLGAARAPGAASVWGVTDPSGKTTIPGSDLEVTTQTPTGETTGGFDQPFYDKYKQGILDYYMPQVSDQYNLARNELTYRLARAGTLDSSAAGTDVADLAKQNTLNEANVRSQADTAAGDLRTQVAGEEQKAVSQLYATEDPEVAANQATSAVRDISLQQPNLSPLSAIFNVADIRGANILKGYQGQNFLNTFKNVASNTSGRNQSVKTGNG